MALRKILDYWWVGPLLAFSLSVYFGYRMLSEDKRFFLPGKTSSGHHQIEQACSSCHAPFGGVKQEACLDCHGDSLKAAMDSHDPSIFNDPRSFSMLDGIDATQCITCHGEHIADRTQDGPATVPKDFCFFCHKDIETERPSHRGMSADGCAASGCHNYHDNQALYEEFLEKHLDEEKFRPGPSQALTVMLRKAKTLPGASEKSLTVDDHDGNGHYLDRQIIQDWAGSQHAESGVNCSDCHQPKDSKTGVASDWTDYPPLPVCENCHAYEAKGFFDGKHGIRLAVGLTPMSPGQARIQMKPDVQDKPLTCNACHNAHRYDTQQAAVKACRSCHNDIHSKEYSGSPHDRLWQAEIEGNAQEGTGVSCATCHMPRTVVKENGTERVAVVHNQNANLRPNTKMIRTVCLECHGLDFTLRSLADADLRLNNYSGMPQKQIETLGMIRKRKHDRLNAGKKSSGAAAESRAH